MCALGLCVLAVAASAQEEPEARAVFVNRILFSGNESVPAGDLRARMRTREPSTFSLFRKPRLDTQQLDRDIVQLAAYYHSLGFPEAEVRLDRIEYLEKGRFADIYIRVVEGKPNRVESVGFLGCRT